MDLKSTNDKKEQNKETRPVLFLLIIPLLLAILLTGIAVIGVCLLEQSDRNMTSQLKGLGVLVAIIAVVLLLTGSLRLYSSVRYIQLPVWRWIARGFKGEPKLPFPRFSGATKSAKAKAKSKMDKKQRACIWLGNTCAVVGVILTLVTRMCHIVLDIRGEEYSAGSIWSKLFWVGIILLFTGICVSGLVYKRILKTRSFLSDTGSP